METVWKGLGLKSIINHITYQKANLTVFTSRCILKTKKALWNHKTFIIVKERGYSFTMMIMYNDNADEL